MPHPFNRFNAEAVAALSPRDAERFAGWKSGLPARLPRARAEHELHNFRAMFPGLSASVGMDVIFDRIY